VSNALIEYNDIHSEDSAIAIELNPAWNWGGYDIVENVVIKNNYVSTASPTDPDKLMNDDDLIYGTGLADAWIGQSAVDIFYNENFDSSGSKAYDGRTFFRNIEIKENAFENVRQGVRCGFFIGASLGHLKHRIYNLTIKDHEPSFLAGRNKDKSAGIRNVTKNTYPDSWNKSGGAGIAIRYTDSLVISNNHIENCSGGLGVSIENVTRFTVVNNRIDKISGKQLGDLGSNWAGGEGIRVNNRYLLEDPNLENGCFNARYFLIEDNYIGQVETTKIAVISTKNGIVKLDENYDLSGVSLCSIENSIYKSNVSDIDWGCTSNIINSKFNYALYPGDVVYNDLLIELSTIATNVSVSIFDLYGKKILSQNLDNGMNRIPMRRLSSGVYLLFFQGLHKNEPRKIIKK
jgi:hypothetical protein